MKISGIYNSNILSHVGTSHSITVLKASPGDDFFSRSALKGSPQQQKRTLKCVGCCNLQTVTIHNANLVFISLYSQNFGQFKTNG
jgi:hypothetical protein